LKDIPGVGTAFLDRSDIVRHPLVQAIVDAYEAGETPRDRRPNPEIESVPAPSNDASGSSFSE